LCPLGLAGHKGPRHTRNDGSESL